MQLQMDREKDMHLHTESENEGQVEKNDRKTERGMYHRDAPPRNRDRESTAPSS
jgi:hypothetical protein